jgi:hypothetical protein
MVMLTETLARNRRRKPVPNSKRPIAISINIPYNHSMWKIAFIFGHWWQMLNLIRKEGNVDCLCKGNDARNLTAKVCWSS